MVLYVYFNAPGGRPRPIRQWIRIARNRPRVAISHFARWTICKLTGSRLADVAVGDDFWTLELNPRGDRLLPAEWYFLHYPNLAWCVVVELRTNSGRSDELRTMADARRHRTKLTMPLSWLTGGRFPSHDCVQKARAILRAHGVDTPRMAGPIDLWVWLQLSGYSFIPLMEMPGAISSVYDQEAQGLPPSDAGGVDRDVDREVPGS